MTEGFLGVSQLLTPKTTLSATFTFGAEDGYLNDPYRLATFDTFGFAFHEQRPANKTKEVFLLSLTQYIQPLHAGVEGSYRFYHDSWDVYAQTAMLTWRQWLGKHFLLEPRFRYTQQSAAYFYGASFPGITPPDKGYFSADYRLSRMQTFDYGLQATVKPVNWLRLIVGYYRYEMYGLDNITASAMYPKANVFTGSMQLWW